MRFSFDPVGRSLIKSSKSSGLSLQAQPPDDENSVILIFSVILRFLRFKKSLPKLALIVRDCQGETSVYSSVIKSSEDKRSVGEYTGD